MKIKELYIEHLKAGEFALIVWMEYLVKEKKVVSMNDDVKALNKYFASQYKDTMNSLIHDYIQSNRNNKNWVCYEYYKKRNII